MKFHFTIDEGPEQTIEFESGVYMYAAAALPSALGLSLEKETVVKIWVSELLPEYGPYYFILHYDDGMLKINNAIMVDN